MSVQLVLGPMFSGKTSELLRRLRRYNVSKNRVLLVKFVKDVRYGTDAVVRTHDGTSLTWCDHVQCGESLVDILNVGLNFDVVGIDEGQFFDDLCLVSNKLANAGKHVVIAALNGNFNQHPFQPVAQTLASADEVVHLTAVCMECCRRNAVFTIQRSHFGTQSAPMVFLNTKTALEHNYGSSFNLFSPEVLATSPAAPDASKTALTASQNTNEYAPHIGGDAVWTVVCRNCLCIVQKYGLRVLF